MGTLFQPNVVMRESTHPPTTAGCLACLQDASTCKTWCIHPAVN
ncbi:hypothetical protein RRSWK_03268 [Rhodopirellula sp. SWK7]|nr:hypothetical protein RRSWK_03268 [Rhodopirellula sp. SWK7]